MEILNVYLEHIAVVYVMAADTWFAFFPPHFYYTTPRYIVGHKEVVITLQRIPKVVKRSTKVRFVFGKLIYLCQAVVVFFVLGKAFA